MYNCVIEDILKNKFSKRYFEGKQLIMNNGRPTAKLFNLQSYNKKRISHF